MQVGAATATIGLRRGSEVGVQSAFSGSCRAFTARWRAMPQGSTPNPTYEEVCSGYTVHNEVVLVVYDPKQVSYETLLQTFWESHDPTQGMR